MDTVIKCLNVEIPLLLHRARVVHANKYTEAHGGAFDLPVSSTLYTDVVFRLYENDEDYKAYIEKLDLPIYNNQEVTIICCDKTVIGYIDMQTNYYYYTVTNFSRLFGLGLSSLWVWIITILGGIAIYATTSDRMLLLSFTLFIIVYGLYFFQRWYINRRVRQAIDAVLK
jgi:hypothetical protein